MKKDEREKRLIPHYKKHAGHTKMIIEMLYLQYIRQVIFFFFQHSMLHFDFFNLLIN